MIQKYVSNFLPVEGDFLTTPPTPPCFFANNKRSHQQISTGMLRVFGHVVRDLQRNHPTVAKYIMRLLSRAQVIFM